MDDKSETPTKGDNLQEITDTITEEATLPLIEQKLIKVSLAEIPISKLKRKSKQGEKKSQIGDTPNKKE